MDEIQLKRWEIPHRLLDQHWPGWNCRVTEKPGLPNNFCNRGRQVKVCDHQINHLGSQDSALPSAGLQPPLGICYLLAPHAVLSFTYELQGKTSNCVEEMKDLFLLFPFSFLSFYYYYYFLASAFCPPRGA